MAIFLLFLCVYVAHSNLLNDVTERCIKKMNLNEIIQLQNSIEFWQTWSQMEFVNNVIQSNLVEERNKDKVVKMATEQWVKFDIEKDKVPSVFKDTVYFKNHKFWSSKNMRIIWDDRLWLGNSYCELYKRFGIQKYLEVAERLYNMIISDNANPRSINYTGIEWKPKTDYRNSVTNELFLILCGRLYEITNSLQYLQVAQLQFDFLFNSFSNYINSNNLNIFSDADGPGGYYTYNQGLALQGLAFLIQNSQTKKQQAFKQLCRLIKGTIQYFHIPSQNKLIMIEPQTGNNIVGSVFRGVVFKHLMKMKQKLTQNEWRNLNQCVPKLKPFILDNAQAMARFETVEPGWNWTKYNDAPVRYYNVFNQFYVLNSAQKLFNITQLIIPGIQLQCNSTIKLSLSSQITQVKMTTTQLNEKGQYKHSKSYPVLNGPNNLHYIIGQNICNSTNNRNIFTFEWSYSDGIKSTFTLVHVQGQNSKFGFIPDTSGEKIINNHYVRINSSCAQTSKTYDIGNGKRKLKLSSSQPCGKKQAYLILNIQ